jgi:hypothetical protein
MSAFGPADISWPHMSAIWGKADMAVCGGPLSRSLLGVKRTSLFAPHMSAYDPKRTSVDASSMFAKPIPSLEAIGGEHEAAGIYLSGIRGGGLANHRLCTGENSPDRVSAYRRRRTNGTRF